MALRVVFLCGHLSPYGKAHLEPLLNSGFEIAAVVIADKKRWEFFRNALAGEQYLQVRDRSESLFLRTQNLIKPFARRAFSWLKDPSIDKICARKNTPLLHSNDVNDPSFIKRIADLNCDLILSVAFPQIFSNSLIATANLGSVNFHPSLLPKFRGAHPHFWAIARGATNSGLTAHFMTNEIDEGDIISQVSYPIRDLSYGQLYGKMIENTPSLVASVEAFFTSESRNAVTQENSNATLFRNDRDIHHRIFWDVHSAEEISNLVRTERAYCFFRNDRVGILEVYVTESNRNLTNDVSVPPGVVVDFYKDALVIKAIDGCVNVKMLEAFGKRIGFDKWINKVSVYIGERFS